MNEIPIRARVLILAITFVAAGITIHAALSVLQWHLNECLTLMVIGVLASRLKVNLPGLNGNMSVNLPFVLIGVAHLSFFEALLVALSSTAAQCFPNNGGRPKAVQILFNISTALVAIGLSAWAPRHVVLGRGAGTSALLIPLAAATYFLAQTLPVSTIISLTEGGKALRIWAEIVHLSFPYYVLSAGMASMVTAASDRMGWQVPLLVLPVMYGVHRSYRLYFRRAVEAPQTIAMAKSASC